MRVYVCMQRLQGFFGSAFPRSVVLRACTKSMEGDGAMVEGQGEAPGIPRQRMRATDASSTLGACSGHGTLSGCCSLRRVFPAAMVTATEDAGCWSLMCIKDVAIMPSELGLPTLHVSSNHNLLNAIMLKLLQVVGPARVVSLPGTVLRLCRIAVCCSAATPALGAHGQAGAH